MTSEPNMAMIERIIDERMETWEPYNSPYEAWAVMYERYCGASGECQMVDDEIDAFFWDIRCNSSREDHVSHAMAVYQVAKSLAVMALDVATAAKKCAENCEAGINRFGLLKSKREARSN